MIRMEFARPSKNNTKDRLHKHCIYWLNNAKEEVTIDILGGGKKHTFDLDVQAKKVCIWILS